MTNIGVSTVVNRNAFFAAFTLLTVILASVSLSRALAQGSGARAIDQAQGAVREQITSREGGRNPAVVFNSDTQTEFISNTGVRVRGTGAFSRNNDPRNNNGQSRNFSYEAIVNDRNRNRNRNSNNNVSGIKYDWRGGWSGNGGGDGADGRQSVYCASDDGRRHTCPVNTGGVVRLVTRKSGSACVQGRTWGFNRNSIWVDRGCRADFEVGRGKGDGVYGRDNDRRDNNSGYGNVNRPNGRVSYSGPIMNRHSDKALDVTEQGMQDGANIQQWSYADQANQNWDVIDLGANEVAIISRHSGRALTVQGGRDNNGANIIQQGWNDNPQQR